jgi:hypothetical protein
VAASPKQQQPLSNWGPPTAINRGLCTSTGHPHGKSSSKLPHINSGSSPVEVFMLIFAEVIQMLVVETNCCYQQYLEKLGNRLSPLPHVTDMDMILFLILILKMGHDMTDCWSKTEKFYI